MNMLKYTCKCESANPSLHIKSFRDLVQILIMFIHVSYVHLCYLWFVL